VLGAARSNDIVLDISPESALRGSHAKVGDHDVRRWILGAEKYVLRSIKRHALHPNHRRTEQRRT